MPIRFLIKMRRLMYYWHILHRDTDELIFKFYSAQKHSPSEGDWVHQIRKDMADLKLELSEADIRSMSQYKFKNLIRNKMENLAISYLESQKKQKCSNLNIKTFSPQEYILSKNLSISEVQTLFKIRNSMIDVKANFKANHESLLCSLCLSFCETQDHLINCTKIREKLKGVIEFDKLNIEMAYQSLKNQELLAKYYTIILNARKDMISHDNGNQ